MLVPGLLTDVHSATRHGEPSSIRRFDFATTATNITTLMAASVACFTNADWDTRDGAFASAATDCAGSGSLAVTFRTQKPVWHLTQLPVVQYQ
jgi:hypothetical protein